MSSMIKLSNNAPITTEKELNDAIAFQIFCYKYQRPVIIDGPQWKMAFKGRRS